MIVRDEEKNLPRALGSIEGLGEEMVIVDTGSQDATVEIAQAAGARVEHFEWCDDFSAARNFAMSHASGEWIMLLDADDEFERSDVFRARELLRSTSALGVAVLQKVLYPEIPPITKAHLAFVRNRPDLRFEFRMHEQIPLDPTRLLHSDLRMTHYGYTAEHLPGKFERNQRLLERMKTDSNPVARAAAGMYLGRMFAFVGRLEEAFQEYKAVVYGGVECHYRLYAAVNLARLCAEFGDRRFAEELFRSVLGSNPGAVEAELGYAILLLRQGRIDEALEHFETACSSSLRIFPSEDEPWEAEARRRLERAREVRLRSRGPRPERPSFSLKES